MTDASPYAQFVQPDAAAPPPPSAAPSPYDQFLPKDATPASASDSALDIAKQIPAGLAEGVANIPTAVPRILNAVGPAINSAMEKVVGLVSPAKAAEMHQVAEEDANRAKAVQSYIQEQHPGGLSGDLGLPQPQTTAGQYARTAGEFAPGMMGAPGNLARNAVTGAGAGIASDGAGEAFKGTPYEGLARVGAGVAGGIASGLGGAKTAAANLTPENVLAAGSAGYESPIVKNILIAPGPVQNISDNIISELDRARLNDRIAPQTRAVVSDLATPVGGALHSVEDYQTTRGLLGKIAGNFNNPIEQTAASKAIASLDQQFKAIPQSQVVSGDIGAANQVLENARANYAAGSAAQRVQQKLDNAELQAASAHSGANIDNATRQKLRPLLTSPSQGRGFTPDELGQLDQVVRGSTAGNALRAAGSALGGRGGLGTMVSAAEGMHLLGPAGAAVPIGGYAVKSLGDLLTKRAANNAVQQILSRAPAAATLQSSQPELTPLAAILANAKSGAVSALPQPQPLPSRSPNRQLQPQ